MREAAVDKIHIFIVLFFISLTMRIQGPVFTPYAAAFGASSIFIGLILSVTSLANLSGNILAGPLVDRFGKKVFITLPIFAAGTLFIIHGLAQDSIDLLILHGLNGFALAFLIPAALTLLSGYAKNRRQQGKNIAINGMLSTVASIIAPLIGGELVLLFGYENTYFIIGAAMLLTGIYSLFYLKDRQVVTVNKRSRTSKERVRVFTAPNLLLVYCIGFAVMYLHGVLIFEIPYLTVEQGLSPFRTGQLFSYMGIGTLVTLSLFFIHRFDPIIRLMIGLFGMSIVQFGIYSSFLPLPALLFMFGLFFGLIMPGMATAIMENASSQVHGRAFGYMSAIYSLGIIASSSITGAIRDVASPYFIAFLIGMIVLTVVGYLKLNSTQQQISQTSVS